MRKLALALALLIASSVTWFLTDSPASATRAVTTVVGDFTGDGTADPYALVPSTDATTCTLTITPGDTTGPYANRTYTLAVPMPPSYDEGCPDLLAGGDTNNDGKYRLAMSWFYCGPGPLELLAAAGTGFAITSYAAEDCPSFVKTADLNGDGRADFYMFSDNPGGLWTWLAQPDGLLASDLNADTPQYRALYNLDLVSHGPPQQILGNSDGRTELLIAAGFNGDFAPIGELFVYAYGAPLAYIASSSGAAALYEGPFRSATPIDVNGDGWMDVNVTATSASTGRDSTFTVFQRKNHSFYLGVTANLSATSVVFGQSLSVNAPVAQTSGSGYPPTGTVTFTIDGVSRSPIKVSASHAYTPLPAFPVGNHTIIATYSGDSRHPAATSPPVDFTVNQAAVTVRLSTADKPTTFGTVWKNSVTVAAVSPGKGTPTGTVRFTLDGVARAPVAVKYGKASFSFAGLSKGPHRLSATYSGSTNFKPGSLATFTHTVQ